MADENAPADGSDRLRMPPYRDARFYQKRKKGKYRAVPAPTLEAPAVDTHCHFHLLDDPALELARCAVNRVEFVNLVTDPSEDGTRAFDGLDEWLQEAASIIGEIAEVAEGNPSEQTFSLPHVRITCGVHPHNARLYDSAMEERLLGLLENPRVSALGEIGLDYHYDFSPREDQRRVFRRQIQLAKDVNLPIALHIREAHDEALRILQDEGMPPAGVLLHCCALPADELKPWVDAGCYIAYGGPLTFKKADEVREAAALVPEDRLLTETDSPYMTPEPMRGVACTPAHVVFTAAKMAEVRGCAEGPAREAFLRQIMANARDLLDRSRA